MKYYNIHTHHPCLGSDVVSIQNIRVQGAPLVSPIQILDQGYYSVGIHPWDVTAQSKSIPFEYLCEVACLPQVLAIGEAGLDKKQAISLELQQAIFELQIKLAETVQKPLLIHCVKAWSELIAIKKQFKPNQPWIIHGYRGNAILAQQLLKHGFYLSYATYYNSHALPFGCLDHLFIETDDSETTIQSNYTQMAWHLGVDILQLQQVIANNFRLVFKRT